MTGTDPRKPESAAVITGIGTSAIGRRLGVDPWRLTADAALAAIADAGLTPPTSTACRRTRREIGSTPGITGAGADDVRVLLGLQPRW
ncbi:hypothetical protein ACU686_44860 [Yinghuangia aomiensis]